MAEINPFRALHYDPQAAGELASLVTQPYDKITAEMQARYYAAGAYNLARIIRRRADPAEPDPYAAAAREFRAWIQQGILAPGSVPALYPYDQEYAVPGEPGTRKRRGGFIGLCRLEEYSAGVVYRHEETLSGPKADRLALLRATHAHFGQIFFLYSDPEAIVERELAAAVRGAEPWESVEDEYGTRHEAWCVSEAGAVGRIQQAMRDRKLVIADGHHRYETALAFRNSQRAEGRSSAASEHVMATFVRMESPGLVILPTHRIVHGLRGFEWPSFLSVAQALFQVEELAGTRESTNTENLRAELSRAGLTAPAFIAYAGPGRAAVLKLQLDRADAALPGAPAGLRRLDVFVLHRLVLEGLLGIDPDAVREERNLHYEREMDLAVRAVAEGRAQICFLMNRTPIEAVRDNAFAGQVMPQKSTDFYPKLLSGLTIYDLEACGTGISPASGASS